MRHAHACVVPLLLASAPALAQFAIPWSTIDGGGGTSTGGSFSLSGTIGQPDAGTMSGGSFAITGGYWSGGDHGCSVDLDNGSGTGTPDGAVTIDDILYFLVQFEAGSLPADLDDGTGTGVRDGAVTIDDLLHFLIHFEAGC